MPTRTSATCSGAPWAIRPARWSSGGTTTRRIVRPRLLRRVEADVASVHEPFDRTGLDAEPVAVESTVAAVPATHPLAHEGRATLAAVADRYPRRGLTYLDVPEAPPAVLAIAWPQRSRSTAVTALVRAATESEPAQRAP